MRLEFKLFAAAMTCAASFSLLPAVQAKDANFLGLCTRPPEAATKALMIKIMNDMSAVNCQAVVDRVSQTGQLVLDMPEYPNLKIFSGLPVKDLTVIGNISPQNALTLSQLKGLRSFALLQNQREIKDLGYLKRLKNLTELDISGNPIKDYRPLASLTGLRKLRVSAQVLRQPKALLSLEGLVELAIYGGAYKSLAFATRLPKLETLSLVHVRSIDSKALTPLTKATSLAGLDISTLESSAALDLRYLTSPYIRTLLIDGFRLLNIKALAKTPNLVGLTLTNAKLDSIKELPTLRYLRRLNLSNNPLNSLPDFEKYPELTTLVIQSGNIRAFNPKQTPAKLETLILDFNPICNLRKKPSASIDSCQKQIGVTPRAATPRRQKAALRSKTKTEGNTGTSAILSKGVNLNQIRSCYEKHLEKHPKAAGKLIFSWNINQRGKAEAITLKQSTIDSSDQMSICINEKIQSWSFDAPHRGKRVTYPFGFTPP